MTDETPARRPFGASLIAIVNAVGLVLTLLFWGMVWLKRLVPWPGELATMADRGNAATTYGFLIGDVIYSAPLLFIAAAGVWRMKMWGWTAAQMASVLWIYSLTVILFRDAYTVLSPGGLIFLPFALFSFWAIFALWKIRARFS